MAQIISDDHVVFPIAKMARRRLVVSCTYTFTVCPGSLSSPKRMGVPHGSEVPYLFGTLVSMVGANHMHGGRGQAEPQGDAVLGGVRPEQEPHRGRRQCEAVGSLQCHGEDCFPYRNGTAPGGGDIAHPALWFLETIGPRVPAAQGPAQRNLQQGRQNVRRTELCGETQDLQQEKPRPPSAISAMGVSPLFSWVFGCRMGVCCLNSFEDLGLTLRAWHR
ncbi:unnamed protein product [Caretta caretta]